MTAVDPPLATAENYRRFAHLEAAGRSPAYERLALDVAQDETVLAFLHRLPPAKRQPNLLFAAARLLATAVPEIESLRALVTDRADELERVMLERRTQTNEPARCATLLPALCRLPQPLALIEVGASAGLMLLGDYYSYDFDGRRVDGLDAEAPLLACRFAGEGPVPEAVPQVIWRRGIDLYPLDPANEADVQWLECLIWPGEEGRAERLRAAVEVARRHPVRVQRGDLLDDLADVVATAPTGATTVVFNSAVLAYVASAKRIEFGRAVKELGVYWLSNEAPGLLPEVAPRGRRNGFLLAENGTNVLAETDPHGTWVHWIAS